MANIIERIKKQFEPYKPLPAGIYHYQSPPNHPLNYRLHLRLEEDGKGILVVNASTVLHLNETASEYAYYLVNGTPKEEALLEIKQRYDVSLKEIEADYDKFNGQIETLVTTPDLDPISFLDIDRHIPYPDHITAPYRLDCAITYKLPEGVPLEAAPTKRVDQELTTEEWKSIIDKAWSIGIPHILFTGGEPTLRDDLPELIRHAENNGQVTGLLTNGIKLGDTKYLNSLLQAGLDHTMIIIQPDEKNSWESLTSFAYWSETLDEDIFVAAHLTLTKENAKHAIQYINKLTEAGVSAISLSESDKSLSDELQIARDHANEMDIDLVWDIPVPYSQLNPVNIELETDEEEIEKVKGTGRSWLYVEPDGDVLPDQGINHVLGNFLKDDWGKIWEAAKNL
ncbi:MAG: radical SAM protein [Anaerolineales bacterium]